MRYFLSYVESGIHASLMLSTQESPDKPAKITYEAGFDINGQLQSIFGKQQGYYVEEDAASKAAYSSMHVRHRSYEISEAEAAKFFSLINKHRTTQSGEPLSEEESQSMIKGPKFQLLTNNCKAYALNVFKEMGIFEAKTLSNTFIQNTHSKKSKKKVINRNDIVCPIKETFIRDFNNLANEISHISSRMKLSVASPPLINAIDDFEKRMGELKNKSHKIAIEEDLYAKYQSLFVNLETIADLAIDEIKKNAGLSDDGAQDNLINQLDQINLQKNALVGVLDEIKQLDESHRLPFEWSKLPKMAKRVNLDAFNPTEKEIYSINYKSNEITDGLNDIAGMIESNLKSKKLSHDARHDMLKLLVMVEKAKGELHSSHLTLTKQLQSKDKSSDLKAYFNRGSDLDLIIKNLNDNVSKFEPKDRKSAGPVIKFIRKIINLFRTKSSILAKDPKNTLTKELNAIQNKHSVSRKSKYDDLWGTQSKNLSSLEAAPDRPTELASRKKRPKL